jgi:hypothetical protein
MVTLQTLPAVLAQPVHDVKAAVEAAVAVSCTGVFGSNWPVQLCVQPTPAGVLSTRPAPVMLTRRATEVNVAVTVLAVFMVTVQSAPATDVHPVHFVNTEPAAGVALTTAGALGGKPAWQSWPQLMALPTPAIVPPAPPTRESVTFRRLLAKVAVTVLAADIVTVQTLPLTAVQPTQPVNAELGSVLLACTCTTVPCGNFCEQVAPQLMSAPGSVPTTVPVPVPFLATLSVTLLKFAVTVRAELVAVFVTVQVAPLTDGQPVQLVKLESESGVAVRVTVVF